MARLNAYRLCAVGAGILLLLFADVAAAQNATTAPRSAEPSLYFSETGFSIDDPRIGDYFIRRGRVKTFGFPSSRTFTFAGLSTQFFQRTVLQVADDGKVRALNLLDPGFLDYTRINGSTFPAFDPRVSNSAPAPSEPNYAKAIIEFVRQVAPETFNGQPVRFFTTFATTVTLSDAYPGGAGDPALLPLINLEIWGIPTSAPTPDPNNGNFIYQRFQRGIMHYDANCRCTQGLLLADYFKAILTGESLPPDLLVQASTSLFFRQLSTDPTRAVNRPGDLPSTDLRDAFARQPAPVALSAPAVAPPAVPQGSLRSQMKVDPGLISAIDALEATGRVDGLKAAVASGTEIQFADFTDPLDRIHARYTRDRSVGNQPPPRKITVNTRWRGADPRTIATLISHEATHVKDDLDQLYKPNVDACVDFEVRAYTEQAKVWQEFHGPTGKQPAVDDLEREFNGWLAAYRRGPDSLAQRVRQIYLESCTKIAEGQR